MKNCDICDICDIASEFARIQWQDVTGRSRSAHAKAATLPSQVTQALLMYNAAVGHLVGAVFVVDASWDWILRCG